MRIEIFNFRYLKENLPSLNNFKDQTISRLFTKISEAETSENSEKRACIYLSKKSAVLLILTEDQELTTHDTRQFNFSINLQITTDAFAIFKIFADESRIAEGTLSFKKK